MKHLRNDAISSVVELETVLFLEALYQHCGIDFRRFERAALLSKFEEIVAHEALDGISALQGKMLRDPLLASAVLRVASRSARAAFMDARGMLALQTAALPMLASTPWPSIWLAECYDAEYVVRLVALLAEAGLLRKTRLYVTGANGALLGDVAALTLGDDQLAQAENLHALSGGTRALREHCTLAGGSEHRKRTGELQHGKLAGRSWTLDPALGQQIVWWQHDLGCDASFHEFELIIFARPLAELQFSMRQQALNLFALSTCANAVLQIDAEREHLGGLFRRDFTTVLGEQGLYRRLG